MTDIDDKIVMRAHLRRSEAVLEAAAKITGDAAVDAAVAPLVALLVGRCRLNVSKPVLKAPMVSALETRIS